MGRPLPIDDQAVEELKKLSPVSKEWLGHHIRNCLQIALTGAETNNKELMRATVHHVAEDLERIGC